VQPSWRQNTLLLGRIGQLKEIKLNEVENNSLQ